MPEIIKLEKSEILRSLYKLHLEKTLPSIIKSLGSADETILFEKKNHKENLCHKSKYLKRDRKKKTTFFSIFYSIWNKSIKYNKEKVLFK